MTRFRDDDNAGNVLSMGLEQCDDMSTVEMMVGAGAHVVLTNSSAKCTTSRM